MNLANSSIIGSLAVTLLVGLHFSSECAGQIWAIGSTIALPHLAAWVSLWFGGHSTILGGKVQ